MENIKKEDRLVNTSFLSQFITKTDINRSATEVKKSPPSNRVIKQN